jgi:hypothetical protein
MYYVFHKQMMKMLGQLDKWLETAEAHAKAKNFDPNVLIDARLAPDQFAFVRQVQSACDVAKLSTVRLTGKEAPVQPDTERTIEELHARVRSTIKFLETVSESDYANAATRLITHPRWEGKGAHGADYFIEHAIPNFFFHTTHAYAILRHNGVDVGKKDYLGPQTRHNI